ncbi:LOW QUALITY PROTEIN: post-GPI attachment to proteins factor 3 [Sarcophilus harrisii]
MSESLLMSGYGPVFHIRDMSLTKKMAYFVSTVILLIYLYCVRTLGLQSSAVTRAWGMGEKLLLLLVAVQISLSLVHLDYSYNMMANVAMGLVNLICWCLWKQPHLLHMGKCYVVMVLMQGLAFLELDLPPFFLVLDAHAMYISTILIHFLFFIFLMNDSLFLPFQSHPSATKRGLKRLGGELLYPGFSFAFWELLSLFIFNLNENLSIMYAF